SSLSELNSKPGKEAGQWEMIRPGQSGPARSRASWRKRQSPYNRVAAQTFRLGRGANSWRNGCRNPSPLPEAEILQLRSPFVHLGYLVTWFPNSVWEPVFAKLCFEGCRVTVDAPRETAFRTKPFPNRSLGTRNHTPAQLQKAERG